MKNKAVKTIYVNFKTRLFSLGIKQNRLAQRLGIDEAHLSRIINGYRTPTPPIRAKAAELLQCDSDWLFEETSLEE